MPSQLPSSVLSPTLLLAAPLSYGAAFRTLPVCVLLEFPPVKQSKFGHESTHGYSPVVIDYLIGLRDRVGFKVHLMRWNTTFREFIDHMEPCVFAANTSENCPCDIGIGVFTMTNERVKKIDFLWAFSDENHHMIGRTSDLSADGDGNLPNMFSTYSWEVRVLISVAVLAYAAGTAAFGNVATVNRARYHAVRPLLRERHTRAAQASPSSATAFKHPRSVAPAPDISASSVTVHLPRDSSYPTVHTSYVNNTANMSNSSTAVRLSGARPKIDEMQNLFTRLAPQMERLAVVMVCTFGMFIRHLQEADATRVSSVPRILWRLLSITSGVFLFCLYNSSLTALLFESVKDSR